MKKIVTISVLIAAAGIVSLQSAAQKQKKQAKVVYQFPDAMAQPVRDEYLKLCEKGRVLYELSCSGCHNMEIRGKITIPDFTEDQLGAYSIRVANARHEEHVSEAEVSAEDLALISSFLIYKKKNQPLILINKGLAHDANASGTAAQDK